MSRIPATSHAHPVSHKHHSPSTEKTDKATEKMQKAFDEIMTNIRQLIELLGMLMNAFKNLEDAGKTESKKDDKKAIHKISQIFDQMGKEVDDIGKGLEQFSEVMGGDPTSKSGPSNDSPASK